MFLLTVNDYNINLRIIFIFTFKIYNIPTKSLPENTMKLAENQVFTTNSNNNQISTSVDVPKFANLGSE